MTFLVQWLKVSAVNHELFIYANEMCLESFELILWEMGMHVNCVKSDPEICLSAVGTLQTSSAAQFDKVI